MSLIERTIEGLKKRRNRILNGNLNCIPSPFERFKDDFIGIEQACYITVTSFTKGGKSQFTSYTFIYKPLMYCYNAKSDIKMKILYFPLEETPERITQRFMSWLLYDKTNGRIRVSPKDLRSTTGACPQEALDMLETQEFKDILAYFEEHIIFPAEAPNPTGIYKYCKQYAEEHGKVTYRKGKRRGELGEIEEVDVFESYEQDDPNEYRLVVIDTINLIDTERGMTLKQSMDKMSEYLAKYLRNRYNYSPIVIQQQTFEQEGNEAFKLGKMRPSVAGLGDSKYTSRDSNIVLGLFSPMRFGLTEYMGYNIGKFRDHIRFLEVCVNRDGEMGGISPLFFDGAVCDFRELPLPNEGAEIDKYYKYIQALGKKANTLFMMLSNRRKKKTGLHKYGIFSIFAGRKKGRK